LKCAVAVAQQNGNTAGIRSSGYEIELSVSVYIGNPEDRSTADNGLLRLKCAITISKPEVAAIDQIEFPVLIEVGENISRRKNGEEGDVRGSKNAITISGIEGEGRCADRSSGVCLKKEEIELSVSIEVAR